MRIYISGPITGTDNYRKRFEMAQAMLEEEGHTVINPTVFDGNVADFGYEEYMDLDLMLLSKCEAMYLLSGWESSRGANREYGYALAKDLIILRENVQE